MKGTIIVDSIDIYQACDKLIIVIPKVRYKNGRHIYIKLIQPLPKCLDKDMTVQIVKIGDETDLPIIMPCGNYLYADQMEYTNTLYLRVNTDTLAFRTLCTKKLKPTKHKHIEL